MVKGIDYFVTEPETQVVSDMGHFFTTRASFTDTSDPFHRAPSFMTYDRETNEIVMQDSRAWIAGEGDEGGGGTWLSTIMKQFVRPDEGGLEKVQQFVGGVLAGGLRCRGGEKKFGV